MKEINNLIENGKKKHENIVQDKIYQGRGVGNPL